MLRIVWKRATIRFRRVSTSSTNTPTILNGPTSRNSVDLNQMSVEDRQLVHFHLTADQDTFGSGTYGQRDWNVRECHHAWSAVLDKWSVACGPRNQAYFFSRKLWNSALWACLKLHGVRINYHKYGPRCWLRTVVSDVMKESYVDFHLPTDSDYENSGFYLL
jgi:hypothetical protein